MKKTTLLAVAIATVLYASCSRQMTSEQALDFLYSYMPLPDSVDYSREFFAENVELSLKARESMDWGRRVPEREFKHFVLPVRVNNENLDSCRTVFYETLAPRVKGMTMEEAVLEVNHWCHEKVTYTPSDSRTSSPLATIKTATGRCGEESTLLVAALRSICIPARQVYTPRWAHTDDNHAWVEAWVDGKWHFLGACEPEPVLDLGWFNAPASRAMLMHTRVFGAYDGPEDVMSRTDCYTEINVTEGYAPVGNVCVKITDSQGNAVEGADVEFKIYNYAEFYTVTRRRSDASGLVNMSAGLGDLVVWANKDGAYGYSLCPVKEDADTVVVSLSHKAGDSYSDDILVTPPVERANIPEVDPQARELNNQRLAKEDQIRNAYTSTFHNESTAKAFLESIGCNIQGADNLLVASKGNHQVIESFLKWSDDKNKAVALLSVISEKDLRDIDENVLVDHYSNTIRRDGLTDEVFNRYVLNPRVYNEMVEPYRGFLSKVEGLDSAESVAQWVKDNIKVSGSRNPQHLRMRPSGVYAHRTCDATSRGIFFVALCRSLGFPARIDSITSNVEYLDGKGRWIPFEAAAGDNKISATGELALTYEPSAHIGDPKYYYQFSVSRINNCRAYQLNYDDGDSWSGTFKKGQTLEIGDYQIVSGTRLSSGAVLVHIETCSVKEGQKTVRPLILPKESEQLSVIGSLNSEALYQPAVVSQGCVKAEGDLKSILSTTGRGYFVVAVMTPGTEPSNHALKDIEKFRAPLEKWGGTMLILFRNEDEASRFKPEDFPGLPSNIVYGIDADGSIEAQLRDGMMLRQSPVFVIADSFNRVVYVSEGYTIGLGEKLCKALGKTAPGYIPTKENLASRAEFADMKFGIFIHWGIYSMFAQGEWYMNSGVDWKEYAKAARGFYPAYFNADEWVEAIKNSGARYITFTTRHHDSFSMFKTEQSDFNIVDATPWGRDVVGELADACHRQGIRLHLYYSHADWRREDYPWGRTGHYTGRDPSKQDWNSYLAFMKAQLTELLTNYGEIGAIWFDGVWDHDEDEVPFDWCLDEQYELIHRLQPACLVGNNHHMNVNPGEDIQIFERDVPGENKAGYSGDMDISKLPLETCQTMNGMWGYKVKDQNYKSTDELIRLLVATSGKGANLLLNVGPQPSGELPAVALERLKEMGEWLGKYGDSIYGTGAGPVRGEWGVSTRKGKDVYLHVTDDNAETVTVDIDCSDAFCLNTKEAVRVERTEQGTKVYIPKAQGPDRIIRLSVL